MVEGKPWISILIFVIPIILGLLLQQLYNTVDSIVVGNTNGQISLSAVGTTGSITFLFLAIATGFSSGNGILIAQFFGANNIKELRTCASTGIILILLIGLLSTLFGIIFTNQILVFLDVPSEVFPEARIYFITYMAGILFQFGYNIYASILRSIGDSNATLYFLLIASILNIILDIYFVSNLKMGVFGAALATDISQLLCFIAAIIYTIRKYPIFTFKLKEFIYSKIIALKTLTTGFPIAFQLIVVSIGTSLIQRAVNGFGPILTASYTVGYRIEAYMTLPCNAFQTALSTYTGQNIGASKMNRINSGAIQGILLSISITLLISIIIYIFSSELVTLFGLTGQSVEYATEHIKTIAFTMLVLAAYVPLFGVFQGSGHSQVPTIIAIFALTIRVIMVYVLRYSEFLGVSILWWNGIFGFSCAFCIAWSYYLSGLWKKNANLVKRLK